MRDILNKSLAMLVWIATGFFVVMSCYSGAMIIRYGGKGIFSDMEAILGGFLTIIFGVTMSFVFAGICFQIMDTRDFTKHTALSIKKINRR